MANGTTAPAEPGANALERERRQLLSDFTEAGRIERAQRLAGKVLFQVAEPELVIAGVSSYNVLIDATARRVLHGCRDFQGQARSRQLCKHVAAVLLALDASVALRILRSLADEQEGWGLDVIVPRFASGGSRS